MCTYDPKSELSQGSALFVCWKAPLGGPNGISHSTWPESVTLSPSLSPPPTCYLTVHRPPPKLNPCFPSLSTVILSVALTSCGSPCRSITLFPFKAQLTCLSLPEPPLEPKPPWYLGLSHCTHHIHADVTDVCACVVSQTIQ